MPRGSGVMLKKKEKTKSTGALGGNLVSLMARLKIILLEELLSEIVLEERVDLGGNYATS